MEAPATTVTADPAVVSNLLKTKPRYIAMDRRPYRPNGKTVLRWVKDKDGNRWQTPVMAVTVTTMNWSRVYPRQSKRQMARYGRQHARALQRAAALLCGHPYATTNDVRAMFGLSPVAGGDYLPEAA